MLKKAGFEILIASPPEYEALVAEIYFNGKFVALVNQERGLGIYEIETPSLNLAESEVSRKFDLDGFREALDAAAKLLRREVSS